MATDHYASPCPHTRHLRSDESSDLKSDDSRLRRLFKPETLLETPCNPAKCTGNLTRLIGSGTNEAAHLGSVSLAQQFLSENFVVRKQRRE